MKASIAVVATRTLATGRTELPTLEPLGPDAIKEFISHAGSNYTLKAQEKGRLREYCFSK
jgi:hypothetical protein